MTAQILDGKATAKAIKQELAERVTRLVDAGHPRPGLATVLVGDDPLSGIGNALDNTVYASHGDNLLNGGGGIDTVSYAFATAGVTVALATGLAQATGGSGSDVADERSVLMRKTRSSRPPRLA